MPSGDLDRAMADLARKTELLREDLRRREEGRAARQLVCVECSRRAYGAARGWTMRLDTDDELVAFCPECEEEEFGDA
jgi:hypothetical protein